MVRIAAEVEDGVADDLARAVKGDVSAAVAFEKLDAALLQQIGRADHIRSLGVAAERDNRRVLEQKEDVADLVVFAEGDELLLQAKAGWVVDGVELDYRDQILIGAKLCGLRQIKSKSFTTEDTEGTEKYIDPSLRSG